MEININCDLGETSKFCSTENDPLLLGIVNSANVACGYHAGDEPTMKKTVEISKKNGVSIGAHPSFNDPENFGRKRLNLTAKEINKLIVDQINILSEIAEKNSMKVTHVKPHGALNNMACEDFELASVISKSILDVNKEPLVSKDFNHNPHSSIFDLTQTQVIKGRFSRVLSWYDNEWGFSNRMCDTTIQIAGLI